MDGVRLVVVVVTVFFSGGTAGVANGVAANRGADGSRGHGIVAVVMRSVVAG